MRVRRAVADDARELVRLRRVMFAAPGPAPDGRWLDACEAAFATRLASDEAFAAYVIDDGSGRLLSCAVSTYAPQLPSPRTSSAYVGQLLAVVTEPEHRRKGYARMVVTAALRWLAHQDCSHVQLRASHHGRRLYSDLGFEIMDDVFMTCRLHAHASASRLVPRRELHRRPGR